MIYLTGKVAAMRKARIIEKEAGKGRMRLRMILI